MTNIDKSIDYYAIIKISYYADMKEIIYRITASNQEYRSGRSDQTYQTIKAAERILSKPATREEYDCLRNNVEFEGFKILKEKLKVDFVRDDKKTRIKKQKELIDLYHNNRIFFRVSESYFDDTLSRESRIYAGVLLVDLFNREEDAPALLKLKRFADRELFWINELNVPEKILHIATKKQDINILSQLTYEQNNPDIIEGALIVLRRLSETIEDHKLRWQCQQQVKEVEKRLGIPENGPRTVFRAVGYKGEHSRASLDKKILA